LEYVIVLFLSGFRFLAPSSPAKCVFVTNSASEKPTVNGAGPTLAASSTRLWGTAHLTAAVLFLAASVCCAARIPGQTFDVKPLPVPVTGWLVWICGIIYLVGCTVLHARVGVGLRQSGVGRMDQTVAGALAGFVVVLAASRSIFLGPQSRTYAFGLETLTTTLCAGAALSTVLLVAARLWRRPGQQNRRRFRTARFGLLLAHLIVAMASAGGLFVLEQLRPSQSPIP
jgi:hypothetical protein